MLKLTKKETQICRLLLLGFSNKEIGNLTHRSIHTVNAHVRNIYRNNDLKCRVELCKAIYEDGGINESRKE